MSPTLPVPCPHCRQPIRLEYRQAGQLITCRECKQPFEAPKLRELKRLAEEAAAPVAAAAGPTGRPAKRRAPRRKLSSAMFSAGLGLAIVAGIAGFSLFRFANRIAPVIDEAERDAEQLRILDTAPVNDLYAIWKELFDKRLIAEWKESPVRAQMRQGSILRTIAWSLLAVAGGGVLLMLAPLASPRRGTP